MLRNEENGSFVMGAFIDGRLVGTIGFVRATSPKTRHGGFVWGVYVTDSVRRQGVGSALLKELLTRLRSYEGLERISLDVDQKSVRALALYEKFGFRSFGVEPCALKIGDDYVDLHHMFLDLR